MTTLLYSHSTSQVPSYSLNMFSRSSIRYSYYDFYQIRDRSVWVGPGFGCKLPIFFFRWSYNHLYQIYWVDPGPRQIQEPAFLLYMLRCSGQGTIVFWQRQTRK